VIAGASVSATLSRPQGREIKVFRKSAAGLSAHARPSPIPVGGAGDGHLRRRRAKPGTGVDLTHCRCSTPAPATWRAAWSRRGQRASKAPVDVPARPRPSRPRPPSRRLASQPQAPAPEAATAVAEPPKKAAPGTKPRAGQKAAPVKRPQAPPVSRRPEKGSGAEEARRQAANLPQDLTAAEELTCRKSRPSRNGRDSGQSALRRRVRSAGKVSPAWRRASSAAAAFSGGALHWGLGAP